MRVLSRRSNCPKAVACGYSEGAGFVVLTEPSPFSLAVPFCSTPGRPVDAALARCVPGPDLARGCAHLAASLNWATHWHTRRDGVGAATSPPDGVGRVGSQSVGTGAATPELAVRGPSAEAEKSARRRRRAPKTPLDGVGEPSPRGCCRLVVSSHRARGNGTAVAHARRHKALQARLRRRLLA